MRLFLGFDSVRPIEPGEIVAVVSTPQRPFRGDRLFIVEECAAFALHDIRVGKNSQFTNAVNVPAAAFCRHHGGRFLERFRTTAYHVVAPPRVGSFPPEIESDASANLVSPEVEDEIDRMGELVTCDAVPLGVGIAMSLLVGNDGAEPRRFRAVLFGSDPKE